MSLPADPVLERMQTHVAAWEGTGDRRAVFLSCYRMMSQNMLAAIPAGEFRDPVWVDRLLRRFAGYYFEALESYERDPVLAPPVWQIAFDAARNPRLQSVQYLLLGVNAHINYDLVLALADVLADEWEHLGPETRAARYADHCHVNAVIARTIDSVQDSVIERLNPAMELVDRLMGDVDEWLISRLITAWREQVWRNALDRVCSTPSEREALLAGVEANCMEMAESLLRTRLPEQGGE